MSEEEIQEETSTDEPAPESGSIEEQEADYLRRRVGEDVDTPLFTECLALYVKARQTEHNRERAAILRAARKLESRLR